MGGGVRLEARMATAREYIGTIHLSMAELPLMILSIYVVENNKFTARSAKISNQMRVLKPPTRMCCKMFPMPSLGCLVAVKRRGRFP